MPACNGMGGWSWFVELAVWTNEVNVSLKSKHLMLVRDKIGTCPWSANKARVIETAMVRLRLGHAGVNTHLHRFGMKNTQSCE